MLWFGNLLHKYPSDLWVYQEFIYDKKPDVIIECGTFKGGSALFLANIFDLLNHGRIITIDIEDHEGKPQHDRIQYLIGSSTSKEIEAQVKSLLNEKDKVMVILDSAHEKDHVLKELRIYSKLVSVGYYCIVEDTNLNGHPLKGFSGLGPMEAVKSFLKEDDHFKIDKSMERHLMTLNPNGFLKRVK